MRSDKFKAYKLRARGRSYNEISRLLHVPKSTLSGWFSGLVLSEEASQRIRTRVQKATEKSILKFNRMQTHTAEARAHDTQARGVKEIGRLSQRDILLLGTSLYWAEGYKKPIVRNGRVRTYHPVRLVNSDPALIVLFLRFLREVCAVPEQKIIASLRLFEHQNDAYLLDFWQKTTKIPSSGFRKSTKSVSISSQRKRPFNTLPYGILQLSVNDTVLYHKIMGFIEGLKKST